MQGWVLGGDGMEITDFVVGASGYSGAVVGKYNTDADLFEGKEVYLGLYAEHKSSTLDTRSSQSTFFKWYGPRRMQTYA
jgi:hypothetical protein